jgi:type I restriction enzyme S subunit
MNRELPKGWEIKKIKNFAEVITGGTPSTVVEEYWKNGAIPWLPSGDLKNCKITKASNFITKLGLDNSSAKIMPCKTVLIALTGATTGQTGLLEIEASANQSVTGILPSEQHIPEYLFYYLQTLRKRILDLSYGGAQPHISQGFVKNIEVVLPPLSTQKKIVAILEKAEATKNFRAQADELTNLLLKNIFFEIFGDTVKNPKRWEKRELILLVKKDTRISYGIVQPGDEVNNGISVIRPVDIINNEIIYDNIKKISPQIENKFKKTRLEGDEILITVRGTTGDTALTNHKVKGFNVTRGIAVIRPDNKIINKIYLNEFLKSENGRRYVQEHTKGATLRQINMKDLTKMPILVPHLTLQDKFASMVERFDEAKEKQKQSKKEIDNLFGVLMQKAFIGELVA